MSRMNHVGRIVDAEEQDFGSRCDPAYLVSGLDTVHYRHCVIQNDDVGLQLLNFFDSLFAIFSFTAHCHIVRLQKGLDRPSCGPMVVYDQDVGGGHTIPQLEFQSKAEQPGVSVTFATLASGYKERVLLLLPWVYNCYKELSLQAI